MDRIKQLIDNYLEEMSKETISMMTPAEVPDIMQDPSIKKSNDWKGWKPADSIVNDADLGKLEEVIGFKLPLSYKTFLKHKHFYSLEIPDHAVNFSAHLPDKKVGFLRELVFEFLEPELIIGRGYIYFADFHDYGLLCFDTNRPAENNEYPIVYIDHEDLDDIHTYAANFTALLEGDEEKGNEFIEMLNDYHQS